MKLLELIICFFAQRPASTRSSVEHMNVSGCSVLLLKGQKYHRLFRLQLKLKLVLKSVSVSKVPSSSSVSDTVSCH